ncbi:hypothetical protein BOW53_06030 [Solemya pervernicosa gill symbiont]|uniref:Uncharacterized protein n=1 Tax=Solemya pervernicosa gill symbiont TaxID=642797 RepID=A0A1T2L731_9GAMM|nr:hypothetical protein [Solemya pervernicosa gill symbiont]OOZ40891.1 hypothetical protein BOW53_06030 [Solemya pervernicosa gill symbiont]
MITTLNSSLERFTRFIAPAQYLFKEFYPLHARALLLVSLAAIFSSALNASAYLGLTPLINHAIYSSTSLVYGPIVLAATPLTIAGALAIVLLLVVGSLHLNFIVYNMALEIMRKTVAEASVRGVVALHKHPGSLNLSGAIKEVVGSTAYGCGFTMRQTALGLSLLLQLLIFLLVLIWLNPAITTAVIVATAIGGWIFSHSVNKIVTASTDNKTLSAIVNNEYRSLSEQLCDSNLTEEEVKKCISSLYRNGAIGQQLDTKLNMRRQKRLGPQRLKYLFPITLIMVPMLAMLTGDLQHHASEIIIYMVLLRIQIGLLTQLASLFISTAKFQTSLLCYNDLRTGKSYPDCLKKSATTDTD